MAIQTDTQIALLGNPFRYPLQPFEVVHAGLNSVVSHGGQRLFLDSMLSVRESLDVLEYPFQVVSDVCEVSVGSELAGQVLGGIGFGRCLVVQVVVLFIELVDLFLE